MLLLYNLNLKAYFNQDTGTLLPCGTCGKG